jgi:dephospho-CoA kinase
MNKNIIAIVGMCGSGKSVAADLLVNSGWMKIYFGGVTIEKLQEAGLEVNPENEKMMREKLRAELGMGAFAKILLPRIKEYSSTEKTVLDGLYSWDEYKILKDELGDRVKLIAIVVDKDIRFKRLTTREIRPLTNDEAEKRDIAEIENIAKSGPIADADYFIFNNGNLEDYKKRLNEILISLGEDEIK